MPGFDMGDTVPSLASIANVEIEGGPDPADASAIAIPVSPGGDLPEGVDFDREQLETEGFEAKDNQTLVIARPGRPTLVLVGIPEDHSRNAVRDGAAGFARAVGKHSKLAFDLTSAKDVGLAAQAVVEGVLLARYRYDVLKAKPTVTPVERIFLITDEADAATEGGRVGRVMAEATMIARDLANDPPSILTATRLADVAANLGGERGLEVEVFDEAALREMGCGGLLGVNAGSSEPPRMVKLVYRPRDPNGSRLTLVGKGITYDAGGIALKPADEVHATMKNDMSGAGAILAAMLVLAELGCRTGVTGYLMCTDNRPSGTALAMGDVIKIRGGTSVEVSNTDAEGRLVMADALVLATEEETDAIVDIATLTGAAMRALGTRIAGLIGNDDELLAQVEAAATQSDEPVWQLPLEGSYRKQLNSPVADIKNLGGANAGAITAALFLEEFVAGKPWAHIDIAGTAQNDEDTSWRPPGCTGFGARLLVELALGFQPVGDMR